MRDKHTRRAVYQEPVDPAPNSSPVTSDASRSSELDLSLFSNEPRKVAVLTKDDFDEDADRVFKRIVSVLDSDEKYDWAFTFCPSEK